MTATFIKSIIDLTNAGWRPYSLEPQQSVYDKLDCPHANTKKGSKPYWFVRKDMFLCVGCAKKCSLARPEGFVLPLPVNYKEKPESPYLMTPSEMIARKKLLRVDEVAYCLNISERQVYDWVDEGKLRRTEDKPIRVPVEDVAFRMNKFSEEYLGE